MAMSAPRVASTDSFEAQYPSFEYAMLEDRFFHVLTAGRTVPTACRENW